MCDFRNRLSFSGVSEGLLGYLGVLQTALDAAVGAPGWLQGAAAFVAFVDFGLRTE
jgi:hypothetical protein